MCARRVVTNPRLYLNAAKRVRTYIHTYINTSSTTVTRDSHIREAQDRTWHRLQINSLFIRQNKHKRWAENARKNKEKANLQIRTQENILPKHRAPEAWFPSSIYLSDFTTAVAVIRKPNAIPLCFSTDLVLNFLLSWLLRIHKTKVTLKVSTLGFHAGSTAHRVLDSTSFQQVWLGQFTTISYETSIQSRGKTTSIHWRFMHDDIPPHFLLHQNFAENKHLNVNLKQTLVCSAGPCGRAV